MVKDAWKTKMAHLQQEIWIMVWKEMGQCHLALPLTAKYLGSC